ncbi:Protein of unknown function [Lactobacillus pasteurii DSM 23907 = CRBIP 24.76]|uniref:Uncharacterized protein n=1 Tax=Lactobacillus pasteurii DSM 23907 = CRBIP 24.76 TaxID=1423790 RepID=I7LD03_9LACO|nr:Protein of unknown function [Lactobacillus pasteurii DSM 23907 = CRBIP 24.76]
MVRNFKIYEADEFQLTEELPQLAKQVDKDRFTTILTGSI